MATYYEAQIDRIAKLRSVLETSEDLLDEITGNLARAEAPLGEAPTVDLASSHVQVFAVNEDAMTELVLTSGSGGLAMSLRYRYRFRSGVSTSMTVTEARALAAALTERCNGIELAAELFGD